MSSLIRAFSLVAVLAVASSPTPSASSEHVLAVLAFDRGGTAFPVSDDEALTAAHVVGNARFVQLKTVDGSTIRAQVVSLSTQQDLALLQTDSPVFSFTFPLAQTSPSAGTHIVAIGDVPGSSGPETRSGTVTGMRESFGRSVISMSVQLEHGFSGGPVMTSDGRVVGLSDAESPNLDASLAIDVSEMKSFLRAEPTPPSAHASGSPDRTWMSIIVVLVLVAGGLWLVLSRSREIKIKLKPETKKT